MTSVELVLEPLRDKLAHFKNTVLSKYSGALFGFITIPHCSLSKYRHSCIHKRKF